MELHDFPKSGNAYKARLFLSLLGLEYETVPVNLAACEQKGEEFLKLNPSGLVPVLVDGPTVVPDSAAILVYLARRGAPEHWFPADPVQGAGVVRWLAFEQGEIRYGLARARALALGNPTALARVGTLEESQAIGRAALDTLEQQLARTTWLASDDSPTIADIACYPYTAMAGDGGLALDACPNVRRWLGAVEKLDGYLPLP